MIHEPQHTIAALTACPSMRLDLTFADGVALPVDLAAVVRKHRSLAALSDPGLFARARVDARGGYVVWIEDELEMAADNLRNLAVEQACGIGAERMIGWMARHGLTQAHAARSIGVSRRMLNYYLSGARHIPKTVWLACLGWESLQKASRAA